MPLTTPELSIAILVDLHHRSHGRLGVASEGRRSLDPSCFLRDLAICGFKDGRCPIFPVFVPATISMLLPGNPDTSLVGMLIHH